MNSNSSEIIELAKGFRGVCNVIQSADEEDILLLPCRDQDQQESLLEKYLPAGFKGLVVSPFNTKKEVRHIKRSIEEIQKLERPLIDYFYPMPKKLPQFFGVTGTNGKTSVAWLISEVLKVLKKKTLYLGTPGVFLSGEKKEEVVHTTTPSYLDIRKLIFRYQEEGVDAVSLEVSSHALAQDRLQDLKLDVIGWTNFSQDHLDFHKTMEIYFEAKEKILGLATHKKIAIPTEQKELRDKLEGKCSFVSIPDLNNFDLPSLFFSGFPKENLEVALAMVNEKFDLPKEESFRRLSLPPGRFQEIKLKKCLFVVDYAHTPDALAKVLAQIKQTYPEREIISLFGCGGDRDRSKRSLMGEAAARLSDRVIVTSDNPRTEDPQQIIEDILSGIKEDCVTLVDRREAIEKAYSISSKNSVVLIAGKGHENYQEVNGVRYPFDDAEIVRGLE